MKHLKPLLCYVMFSNNLATKYFKFYLLTEVVAVGGSDAD